MSNILYRELASTYFWLKTYIPYRIARKGPVMTRIVRRAHRVQMRKNRVFAGLWTWLRGNHVDQA